MCDQEKDQQRKTAKSQQMKLFQLNQGHQRHNQRNSHQKEDDNNSDDTNSTADDSTVSDHRFNHRHECDEDRIHHSHFHHHHHKQNHHHSCSSVVSSSSSSSSSSSASSSSSSSFSSTLSKSSSNLSSETSSECSDRYPLKKHSQSCTDVSRKHKYFEEDDDTAPLIDKSSCLKRLPAKQEWDKAPHSGTTQGTQRNTQRIRRGSGNDESLRKAKSMEALTRPKERKWHGSEDKTEQERRKGEAMKNIMKEKMKFSAFLNEITRQVLSPMRLTTLGVTDAQRPCSPGKASVRSSEENRSIEKLRQQQRWPASADSTSSSKHSSKSFRHHHGHHSSDSTHRMNHKCRSCIDVSCSKRCHSWSQTPHHRPNSPSYKHSHLHQQGDRHHKQHHSPVYHHGDHCGTTHHHPQKESHSPGHHPHHDNPLSPHHHHGDHHSPGHHPHHGDHHSPGHHHHHGDHHIPGHHPHHDNPLSPHHHHGDHHGPCHQHYHDDNRSPSHHHHHEDHGPAHQHGPEDHRSQGHHRRHKEQHRHGGHHSPGHHHHHGDHHSAGHHHHHGGHQSPGHHHGHEEHHSPGHRHGHEDHHSPGHRHGHEDHHSPGHRHEHEDHHSPGHRHEHEDHHSPGHRHEHEDHHSPGHRHEHGGHHSPGHHHEHGGHHSPGHRHGHEDHHSPGHRHEHEDHHSPGHHHEHEDHHSPGHHHGHEDHHSPGHHHEHEDHHSPGHRHGHEDHHSPGHRHEHEGHHSPGHHHEHEDHHSLGHRHEHGDHNTHLKGHSVSSQPSHREQGFIKLCFPRNTSSPSSQEEEQTSFTGSSLHKERAHELSRVIYPDRVQQEQNQGLHQSFLKTAVRMECLGEEFVRSQKSLEAELQRTCLELSNLKEGFRRIHEDCSSTQQTSNLLEQKNLAAHRMEGERERLNQSISALRGKLADAKSGNSVETLKVTSLLHASDLHFQSNGGINQVVLSITPPPAQYMDSSNYGAAGASGREQSLGPVPEEEESDWSEMGEEIPRFILTGSNRGQTRRHREGDTDRDSESGCEEVIRPHSPCPLLIPHLQFTVHNENPSDGVTGEDTHRISTSPALGSTLLIRSASLEEIPLGHHHTQKDLRGTGAVVDLNQRGVNADESSDDEIIHRWGASNDGDAAIGQMVESRVSEVERLQSAERMLNHFICECDGAKDQGRAEVHGWTGGIPDEVLKGERTQL